jgi:hypothetical protein
LKIVKTFQKKWIFKKPVEGPFHFAKNRREPAISGLAKIIKQHSKMSIMKKARLFARLLSFT